MQSWIERREPNFVCCVPAHAVMEAYDHPELRKVYAESGLNTPDGMAIVWLLRQAGHKQVERVYGPDLLLAACEFGLERGWRHYFYGGTPEAVEGLVTSLRAKFNGLQVAGEESPPFRVLTEFETEEASTRIWSTTPDIVWVGLGSPKQEQWMHDQVAKLNVPVLVGVGAAFDFLSGVKQQAPRWMRRTGLEWLHRLVSEPGRLWKRYLLGYPRFVWLVLMERLGLLK
ncbi:MAG TPA: WecB/TagA/CpsF family glycosyltransferase [Bellilinea sp.]|nr:WecB/TagA/CpsF family glycosyltransferase [Bellilinea sp.]